MDGRAINAERPPWEAPPSADRTVALAAYCRENLGFDPLESITLDVPLVGIRGVAYVLPTAVSPTQRGGHRVHLKGMLLTERAESLLPPWAFFVRCVIDTTGLRPTASREALYEDDTLAAVRDALGGQIRGWLERLAVESPQRLRRFLAVHELGVRALAAHDPEVLRLMLPWLRFETTLGSLSLEELATQDRVIHFTRTVEEYRQIAGIAGVQGIAVVNCGYTYHSTLVEMLPQLMPGARVAELETSTVSAYLDGVDSADELAFAELLAVARTKLDGLDCDVALRAFHPAAMPALHLDDRDARNERSRAAAQAEADDLWAGILDSIRADVPRSLLVLNHRNPLVRRLGTMPDGALAGLVVEALYGQALLQAARPLRPADQALLNRALAGLVDAAAPTPPTDGSPA